MLPEIGAISDEDWRWLRERYGDFILEEPAYAPKLIEIRDTLIGIEQRDRGEIVDLDVVCDRAEAVYDQNREECRVIGVVGDFAQAEIPGTLDSRGPCRQTIT